MSIKDKYDQIQDVVEKWNLINDTVDRVGNAWDSCSAGRSPSDANACMADLFRTGALVLPGAGRDVAEQVIDAMEKATADGITNQENIYDKTRRALEDALSDNGITKTDTPPGLEWQPTIVVTVGADGTTSFSQGPSHLVLKGDRSYKPFYIDEDGNRLVPNEDSTWKKSLTDPQSPLEDAKQKYDDARDTVSPLTLDLNGDGVQTIDHESGAYFDHDGDGFAEQSGWASREDGLLVRDLDGNGQIDTGRELFGNHTQLANGQDAGNGFEALSELDSNQDGKIDADDSAFNTLQVWQDTNGDGVSSADELHTLDEVGVQSIATSYTTDTTPLDAQGNEHRQIGAYTTSTGETRSAEDIWYQTDKTYSIATEWLDVPADIAALPDLAGYGNVYDLHQAMVRDSTGELATLVERFGAETTQAGREILFEQILLKWTGADVYSVSRGSRIDDDDDLSTANDVAWRVAA